MLWGVGVWAAVGLSAGIGLSLGLVGGGGSIITVPVLVYVAGLPAREAVALSLAVVGITAGVGAVLQWRAGNVNPRAAAVFGAAGMLGAPLGARLTPLVPAPALLLLFAALMVVVGLRMARGGEEPCAPPEGRCAVVPCLAAGLGLGVLTGFLGVGGGFLIVPALLRFARATMREATGTSLLVIAANSAVGFAAHMQEAGSHAALAGALTGAALAGMGGGLILARRLRPTALKQAFGALALGVAAFLVVMNTGPFLALLAGGTPAP